jgi:hypothetical protein
MLRCSVGGVGGTDDLDGLPRTPKDVSAEDDFVVPKRAGARR